MSTPLRNPGPQRRSSLPRFAEVAVERARLSVVPRLRSRAPRVPFVTLVSLILLAGVLGLLLFNTSMQQASFTATRLQDQASNLSSRQQSLVMELDTLRDPQRLAQMARRQGLVPVTGAAFLDLQTGEVTGKPTPVTRADDLTIEPPAPAPPVKPAPIEVPAAPVEVPAAPRDPGTRQNEGDGTGRDTGASTGAGTGADTGADTGRSGGVRR